MPYIVCKACHPDNDSFMRSLWLVFTLQGYLAKDGIMNQKHLKIISLVMVVIVVSVVMLSLFVAFVLPAT